MSIATAIQNAQQKVANAYTAVSNKGGTLPATQDLSNLPTAINSITGSATLITKTITENGTYNASDDNANGYSQVTVNVEASDEWQPDPLWWDIKTILQNDPDRANYGGAYIYLICDDFDTTQFNLYKATSTPLESYPVAAKTSDGVMYTNTSSSSSQSFTHTWDKTKDKQSSDPDVKTRYIIFYTPSNRCNAVAPTGLSYVVLYAIYDVSPSLTNQVQNFGILNNAFKLQAFEFVNGNSTQGKTDFVNFCSSCANLQFLPNGVDTSSGTNFNSFCNNCYSLKKMPQLDVSNGTNFLNFLTNCRSLTGEYFFDLSLSTNNSYVLQQAGSGYYKIKVGSLVKANQNFPGYLMSKSLDLDLSNLETSSTATVSGGRLLENVKIKLPRNNFNISDSNNLSKESLQYMADNAPTVSSKTLRLSFVNITRAGGATGTIISKLTNKGWTVN